MLTDIVQALGVDDAPDYPDGRYDVIWTLSKKYKHIKEETSENCPGLDS